MRGRSRMKTLKILREFFQVRLLLPLVIMMILYGTANANGEPGYLDFDNLPETKFTCAGKVIGGYYADLETSCQMFHVCTIGQSDEPMDIKFLCLNGTVFDQETRVCERVDEVDCSKSEKFYYLNLELYGNTMVPIAEEEVSEEPSTTPMTTTTTSTTTTTTTPKPTTTTTYKPPPTHPTTIKPQLPSQSPPRSIFSTFNTTNYNGQNIMGFSSSTIHPSHHYIISSTHKPVIQNHPNHQQHHHQQTHNVNHHQDDDIRGDEEEYEYDDEDEDDYLNSQRVEETNGGQLKPSDINSKFSPHQFIYRQTNTPVKSNDLQLKSNKQPPAISFQQHQFQNGDTHSVTVTTHTATGLNHNKNNNDLYKNHKIHNIGPTSATASQRPQFSIYSYNPPPTQMTASKRIPLLPTATQSQIPPSGHSGLPQLPPFRLRAQGFKLPSQHQPHQFEGYLRQMPQISLHLPFESTRNQKELLGFEDNSADDLIDSQKERKDLKRSDNIALSSTSSTTTTTTSTSVSSTTTADASSTPSASSTAPSARSILASNHQNRVAQHALESQINEEHKYLENFNHRHNNQNNSFVNQNLNSHKNNISSISSSSSTSISSSSSSSSKNNLNQNNHNHSNYDKVLLTPQNRYISTLPKVIITASASVSDASGKKLNYSVGNVLGTKIKTAPQTYDEYKEDDVALDPFFLDVPKIRPRIKRALKQRKTIFNPRYVKRQFKKIVRRLP